MRALAGVSLLLLIGLLLGASMLVYTAYVLIAVFWISSYLSRRWTDSIRAVRTINRREMEVGEEAAIQIRLDNKDRWPVVWVLIEDVLPKLAIDGLHPALKLDGSQLRVTSIPAKGSRLIAYRVTALRRGCFQLGPVVAETGDLLGLHRRFRRITEASYLLVLPKLIPLAGYDVASRRPVGEVKVSYRLLEDPTMISGIRDYRAGDPLRSIHWRASARTGTLQCKQYEPTCVAGAMLVVDLHTTSNPKHHEPMRSDLAVTAAASIAHTLMLMQQQFGLITNGRDAMDRVWAGSAKANEQEFESIEGAKDQLAMKTTSDRLQPIVMDCARGEEHFQQIHRTLARVELSDGPVLDELILHTQDRLPRDATVLIILQEVSDRAALALGMLTRQGYSVSAIVNNFEGEAYRDAVGRLIANRIHVYHLAEESSIAEICKTLALN